MQTEILIHNSTNIYFYNKLSCWQRMKAHYLTQQYILAYSTFWVEVFHVLSQGAGVKGGNTFSGCSWCYNTVGWVTGRVPGLQKSSTPWSLK